MGFESGKNLFRIPDLGAKRRRIRIRHIVIFCVYLQMSKKLLG